MYSSIFRRRSYRASWFQTTLLKLPLELLCTANPKPLAGEVVVKMVASNPQWLPEKLTIPRLELCAAVLLVKLMQRIQSASSTESVQYLITGGDSMIVLSGLKRDPSQLKTFVQPW
ncbi:hypothetical protein HNY73_014917 [Argiope bruennichi]|uniref:Uncharacterized protein n=1 Tax=Argiope bruennichi TaxID=94029 RepID=A0A8T0EVW8_ARGBR|nr:hypothetical protein HNY73_014917 [Argiope bruennichi]